MRRCKNLQTNLTARRRRARNAQERLLWDIRIFDDRRQTVTYVCEAPTLIEQRIGEIARAVQKAL